jgi:hypothetical protein
MPSSSLETLVSKEEEGDMNRQRDVVRVVHYIAPREKGTIRFRGFQKDRFGNGVD